MRGVNKHFYRKEVNKRDNVETETYVV